MNGKKRIKSLTPSPDFWLWVAEYAFGEYLNRGKGFFVMCEPVTQDEKTGRCQYGKMAYVPANIDHPAILQVAAEAARRYDPRETVVVAVYGEDGRLAVRELGAKELGVRPIDGFRAWGVRTRQGRLFPGEVVLLKEDIPGVAERGNYVFLERKAGLIRLCKAGLDSKGAACSTQDGVEVHCDYEECFLPSDGVIVPMPPKIVIEKAWRSEGV